ncbi:MAG: hypothetical protein ABSH32_07135 [Bryobacteraceae bacterium]|jgi:hypothetical protein
MPHHTRRERWFAAGFLLITVVAVLTPQYITSSAMQYGCIALNFTMVPATNTTNPFESNILAIVNDSYPEDSNGWEGENPGACAYEPASTIGIAIVRGLVNQNSPTPPQKQYFIVASGDTP